MATLARFECDCGNVIERPRGKPDHPECKTCNQMVFVRDIEVDIREMPQPTPTASAVS
jgi:hypothetical protein